MTSATASIEWTENILFKIQLYYRCETHEKGVAPLNKY